MRIFFINGRPLIKIWSFRGSLIKVLGRRQRPDVRRAECGCTSTNVCCHLDTFSFGNYFYWIRTESGGAGFEAVVAGYDHSAALRSDGTLVSWGNDKAGQIRSTPTTRVQASGLKHEELTLNCSQCNIRKHCSESFTENAFSKNVLLYCWFFSNSQKKSFFRAQNWNLRF